MCCMQREHEVQEKAAAAAVAQRERDLLEMHMEDQQAVFDHQMAWMTTESEEVSSKVTHWRMNAAGCWHALAL